jgi:hypothetical protein
MDATSSMNLIQRAGVRIAAAVVISFAALAASGCGGAATSAGGTTSGLENKSPAEVLQAAAAALRAAKSVYITGSAGSGLLGADLRIKGKPLRIKGESLRIKDDSRTITLTLKDGSAEVTRIGSDTYLKADRGGLKMLGAPRSVQCHLAGQWLDIPPADFSFGPGLFRTSSIAAQLTKYPSPLKSAVTQATLDSSKVVVLTYQDGSKLYVANKGPAYPLRWDYKVPYSASADFTDYGANVRIAEPSGAIDVDGG